MYHLATSKQVICRQLKFHRRAVTGEPSEKQRGAEVYGPIHRTNGQSRAAGLTYPGACIFQMEEAMTLAKFIIERDIPKVGTFDRDQLRDAAAKSNEVLQQLGPDIQWVESYVADNKTFCVYLAKDEAIIRKHAEISGFPATKITQVRKMIDPTTATP